MNAELIACLRGIGFPGTDAPDLWSRVIVFANYGMVPSQAEHPNGGFKLVLLDEAGHPCWFARCGWTTPVEMEQEAALLAALCHHPFAALHVPESRVAVGPRLFLQASRHLGDSAYITMLRTRSAGQWEREVEEIVALSKRIMTAAREIHPPLANAPTAAARRTQLDHDLALLAANGVSAAAVASLRGALVGVEALPAELQHGDLWPSNVLRAHDRWWFIDFTECGMVWSPLYDILHMLTYAPGTTTTDWYAVSRTTDTWGAARLRMYRRAMATQGFDAKAGGQALAYYLTHLTAYRLRPGVARHVSAPLRRELERVGAFLAERENDPAALLPAT